MIPAKPLDRAIPNIKYRLGNYYIRMGLTPLLPKVRVSRDFSNSPPLPRDAYVINEWPLNVRDHVSQPNSTTDNIIVLYILIYKFFE